MPPVFAVALGLMGAAALVRWCVKEAHRVNAELDDIRDARAGRADRPRHAAEAQARPANRRIPAGVSLRRNQ